MTHGIVRIHPIKAALLARAASAAAAELGTRATTCRFILEAVGEEIGPAGAMARAADALDEQGRLLRLVLARVDAWEAAGRVPPGLALRTEPLTASERDPSGVWRVADEALDAYRSGHDARLTDVVGPWFDDRVFAWAVLSTLGADALVRELDLLAYSWGAPAQDERARVVEVFASLLATTTRAGTPAYSPSALAEAAREGGFSLAVLGLLFTRCERWSPTFLVEAVDDILVPLNEEILGGVAEQTAWFGDGEDQVDGRVLALRAAAADVIAARVVMEPSRLGALVERDVGYADDGAALGALLLVGTSPSSTDGIDAAAARMAHVVRAVAAADAIPSELGDRLGEVTAPWIGSFGSWDFGSPSQRDPVAAVDRGVAARYLDRVMGSATAAGAVWKATFTWSGASLRALGPAPPSVDVKRIADVFRAMTDSARAAHLSQDAAHDQTVERQRLAWNTGVALAAAVAAVPLGAVGGVVLSGTATIVGGEVINRFVSGDRELARLRTLAEDLAGDQRAFELFTLAVLWEQRDVNHLFSQGDEQPADGRAASLVGSRLVDEDGHVVPYSTLNRSGRDAFDAWLLEQNRNGAQVAALIDAAGEEFAKSGDDR